MIGMFGIASPKKFSVSRLEKTRAREQQRSRLARRSRASEDRARHDPAGGRGSTTPTTVRQRLIPSASDASRSVCGTSASTS